MAVVSTFDNPCAPWSVTVSPKQQHRSLRQNRGEVCERQAIAAEAVKALSDGVGALLAASAASEQARPLVSAPRTELSMRVAAALLRVLGFLEEATTVAEEDRVAEMVRRTVVGRLVALDVPWKLLNALHELDFETRKSAARVFGGLLRLAPRNDEAGAEVVRYVRARRGLLDAMLQGLADRKVFFHCAELLQICARSVELAAELFEAGAISELLELVLTPSFDVACEAFATLRALLVGQKGIASAYLEAEFQHFFPRYHVFLIQEDSYTLLRQALRLLGELLLDPHFSMVMRSYVADDTFLQIHMNLLRHESVPVQLDAFHVFKIFVANPARPLRVERILQKNRTRLVRLLETFGVLQKDDQNFTQDIEAVLHILDDL